MLQGMCSDMIEIIQEELPLTNSYDISLYRRTFVLSNISERWLFRDFTENTDIQEKEKE